MHVCCAAGAAPTLGRMVGAPAARHRDCSRPVPAEQGAAATPHHGHASPVPRSGSQARRRRRLARLAQHQAAPKLLEVCSHAVGCGKAGGDGGALEA